MAFCPNVPSAAHKYLAAFFLAFSAIVVPVAASAGVPARDNARTVHAFATVIHQANPALAHAQSHAFAKDLIASAHRSGIDPKILAAIVIVESSWNANARSSAGAIGLGQLMPDTAAQMGVNPRNPQENLRGTARYLAKLQNRFRDKPHSLALTFAAYNAGAQAVANYGGVPPYPETQRYVVKVRAALSNVRKMVVS